MAKQQDQMIYIINTDMNRVKVGISDNPNRRLEQLQSSSHLSLTLMHITKCHPDIMLIERVVHKLLKPHRVRGEWFKTDWQSALLAVNKAFEIVSSGDGEKFLKETDNIEMYRVTANLSIEDRDRLLQLRRRIEIETGEQCSLAKAIKIALKEFAELHKIV